RPWYVHDLAASELYPLSLHDALPIWMRSGSARRLASARRATGTPVRREIADRVSPGSTVTSRAARVAPKAIPERRSAPAAVRARSEEHTSELQSRENLVCRLLLEKKK